MKWLLTRLLAALAAVLLVIVAAGALLGARFSGDPAGWAASQGENAAWLDGRWLTGKADAADRKQLAARVAQGGITELYVAVGAIKADGTVAADPASDAAEAFLAWADEELPGVALLGTLRHRADGSSLVQDRFSEDARAELTAAAGGVAAAGFDGVHLDISPVSVNDPSMGALLEQVRDELGEDALLSVQTLPVELIPGLRAPFFAIDRGERYWSKGFVRTVAERADIIVVPGHNARMPTDSMYGGYMVRQVEETAAALEREEAAGTKVRFGVPARGGEDAGTETAATAVEGIRIGLTRAGLREDYGAAVLGIDSAPEGEWNAYIDGWVAPAG